MDDGLSRDVFLGLLGAAAVLGGAEAVAIGLGGVPGMTAADRLLATAYAMAPYVTVGMVVAGTAAALTALWTRARPIARADPGATGREAGAPWSADIAAGLLALVAFGAVVFGAAYLVVTRTQHRPLGGAALAGVSLAATVGAFYVWAALRRPLERLDRGAGDGLLGRTRPSRLIAAGLLAFGLSLGLTMLVRNRPLMNALGTWPPLFGVAWPVLAALLTWALRRSRRPGPARAARLWRLVGFAGLLCAVATVDLIAHLDARPAVKRALLGATLAFRPLVRVAQPLFDADGDGYAGLLGGGDCDDGDPEIHPEAREIPRNGLDDDCFDGDAIAGPPPEPPPPARADGRRRLVERPNLVLVTIDTLRADRLGAWGYHRPTSPNIDALAARGVRFAWAFSQGPQTKASMPSMFTGRYFSEVDRTPDLWAGVHPENVLIAERLAEAGYDTAGIPTHRFFMPNYGLNQGFDHWDLSVVEEFGRRLVHVSTSHLTTDRALAWLDARAERDAPFFLWVHYFDPHHFYQDHDDPVDWGDSDSDRYDEEIRYTDRHLGRLLERLQAPPLGERTFVVLHADHAEGFHEHGYRYHGQHLYNDQVHVPLILAGPGLETRVVDTPVALLDIVPTLLDLAGLPIPDDLQGVSLLPWALDPDPPEHPPVFIEMVEDATHSSRRAIVDWPWKLQWGITFDEYTLFDLSKDPNEQENLADREPEQRDRLLRRLRRWMAEEVHPREPRR